VKITCAEIGILWENRLVGERSSPKTERKQTGKKKNDQIEKTARGKESGWGETRCIKWNLD